MYMEVDYRESHKILGKGQSYSESFAKYNYRAYVWSWEQSILSEIVKKYMSGKQVKYLDFACGTGRIISFLESKFAESYGVDVSDSMLDAGKKNVKKATLINADLTKNTIFQNEEFDLITTFRFFLNAQPELRQEALSVLTKLLKKDGYLVFNVHMNSTSSLALMLRFYGFLTKTNKVENTLSIKQVSDMVAREGLEIIDTFHLGIIPIVNIETSLPISLIAGIESFASRSKFCKYFSQNIIYVCKRVK